MSIELTQLA